MWREQAGSVRTQVSVRILSLGSYLLAASPMTKAWRLCSPRSSYANRPSTRGSAVSRYFDLDDCVNVPLGVQIPSMSSLTASALLKSRVRRPSMLAKLTNTSDLIEHFPNGATVGWSGFTGVGYPK